MACMGQIRVLPAGGLAGFDLGAVVALARVRGWDSPEVLELLTAAEDGIRAAAKEGS